MADIDPRPRLAPLSPYLLEALEGAYAQARIDLGYTDLATPAHVSNHTRSHLGLLLRESPPPGWSVYKDVNMGFRMVSADNAFSVRMRRWSGGLLPGPLNSVASRREFTAHTISLLPPVHHVKVAWDVNVHGDFRLVAYRPLKPWGRRGPEVLLYNFPLFANPDEVLNTEFNNIDEMLDDELFLQTPDGMSVDDLLAFVNEDEDEDV